MRPIHRRFRHALADRFPAAVPEADFVEMTAELLAGHGFTPGSALACVAVCRDEIARSFESRVAAAWGPVFSFASLAGMLTGGRTGLAAAASHAPVDDGRRALVLYAMAHLAISADGVVGEVTRPGVPHATRACGALSALQEATSGPGVPALDPLDAEQSLLARRLRPAAGSDAIPDLVELTHLAATAIDDDAQSLVHDLVDADPVVDVALFTGIQVHGPGGRDFVAAGPGRLFLDGAVLVVDGGWAGLGGSSGTRTRLARWAARGAVASAAVVLAGARRPISPRVGL